MQVTFIGLGAMGEPMARNIVKGSHDLVVYNRTKAKAERLTAMGARLAESPHAAAREAEVVCTCVSTPDALRDTLLGVDGALGGARAGTLFIDFSTVGPAASREVGKACADANCAFLEAPVSGGVKGAEGGTLTIIVGGQEEDFQRAQPVFSTVGQQVTHVGPLGTGSTIKLINQMLVGANLAAIMEGFVLGTLAGVPPRLLYDVLSTSSGNSSTLQRAVPGYILQGNFQPAFSIELLLKDLDLALQLGEDVRMQLDVTSVARQAYAEAADTGLQQQDITAAILPKERHYGITVRDQEE